MFKSVVKILIISLFFPFVALAYQVVPSESNAYENMATSEDLAFLDSIETIPAFRASDRILILAPHPDDEVVGCGGVIQNALKAKAKLKVLFLTNGDHHALAFIVYEKRLTFRTGEFIHMGKIRRKESIKAMQILGFDKNDAVFLGYPDYGTMEIFTRYWGKTKPFRDFLTRISRVPYDTALSPQASYVGENILADLKKVILDFKPTIIFVSHPLDTNRDHRALYLYLKIALWDLEGKLPPVKLYANLLHVVGWPKPRGYHPERWLIPPDILRNNGLSWQKLELTYKQVKNKRAAISFYESQNRSNPWYLYTFARKNELFGDFPVLLLNASSVTPNQINWVLARNSNKFQTELNPFSLHLARNALSAWKKGLTVKASQKLLTKITHSDNSIEPGVAYALNRKALFIRLNAKNNRKFKGIVYLLGYRADKDFSQMPKLKMIVGRRKIKILEKRRTVFNNYKKFRRVDQELIVMMPLSFLNNPDKILVSVMASKKDLELIDTAWRIIIINHGPRSNNP